MSVHQDGLVKLLAAAYPGTGERTLRSRIDELAEEARTKSPLDENGLAEQVEAWVTQFPMRAEDWVSADAALSDLERLLLGPRSGWARLWKGLRRIADVAFDHYIAVAGLLAGVSGAFYGLAFARFYDSLGITPEQAGFTPTQIVAHSVVGGLVIVLLIALGIFLFFVPLIPRGDAIRRTRTGTWWAALGNAVLTAIAIVGLIALGAIVNLGFDQIWPLAAVQVCFFLLSILGVKPRGDGFQPVPAPMDISVDRYVVVAIASLIPALLLTFAITFAKAEDLSKKAALGQAVRNPKIGIFPFLGVHAEPTELSWQNPREQIPGLPRCVLYLGTSNGEVILFDHRSSSTFHVPGGDVTLDLQGDRSSCEAPSNIAAPTILRNGAGKARCRPGEWRSKVHPRYEYEWIWIGHELFDNGDGRPWLLLEAAFPETAVVYCRVTAHTALGEDTAVTSPVIVASDREPHSSLSGSGAIGGDPRRPDNGPERTGGNRGGG